MEIGAGHATLHVLTSYQVAQTIELRTNDAGLVDRFDVSLDPPVIKSWKDIDAEISKTGAKYSYQVSKVNDGKCDLVAGTNTDLSLPLASIFKLYVLLAVSEAVKAGTVSWDDQLTVTKEGKIVGAAGLDEVPDGTTVSVRTAAQQMISASDNMATDLLIQRLGPGAVERALVTAGHHDPASMTPFPTTHELFSVGWGKPDLRDQWKKVSSSSTGRGATVEADQFPPIRTGSGTHPHPRVGLRRRVVRLCEPTSVAYTRRFRHRRSVRPRRSRRSCRRFPASTWIGRSGRTSAPRAETCPAT